MGYNETTHAGELNRRVELFEFALVKSPTSEKVRQESSLGKFWVSRQDLSGSEEEDGKLNAVAQVKFKMRYSQAIFKNANQYFFRDLDGDFYVNAVALIGGRNRMLELKCVKNA